MTFLWFYLAYLVSLINKTEIFPATKGLETSHLFFSWLLGSFVEAKSWAAKAGFELLTPCFCLPSPGIYRHATMPSFQGSVSWVSLGMQGCAFFRGEVSPEGFVGYSRKKFQFYGLWKSLFRSSEPLYFVNRGLPSSVNQARANGTKHDS